MVDLKDGLAPLVTTALTEVLLTTPTPCMYRLPPPVQGKIYDAQKIEVSYTPFGSMASTALRANRTGAECDANGGGFYLDDVDGPLEIDLCPATCSMIDAARGNVEILIGCTSMPSSTK